VKILQQIKYTILEVKDDFESSLNRAKYLLSDSSSRKEKILLAMAAIILVLLIFRSHSESDFYINLVKIIFITLTSFFIYVSSDTFWFLVKKGQVYKLNIVHRKNIISLTKKVRKDENYKDEGNEEEKIQAIVEFNTLGYKIHTRRYAIEIAFFLVLLLIVAPWFFLYNIALCCAMFVYVFLYEQQAVNQVFDDIASLVFYIDNLHKKKQNKCKIFILENEHQEVKDLTKLYSIVTTN